MNKKISIITPYYKGERFVPQLLQVVNKNFENLKAECPEASLELIIVNDSPNVAVPEICHSDIQNFSSTEDDLSGTANPHLQFNNDEALLNDNEKIVSIENKLYLNPGIEYKLITQPQNGGIHKARVTGLKEAFGDFIQFLDQDDVLDDKALAFQLKNIGDADVIVANAYMEQKDGALPPLYKNKTMAQKSVTLDCFVKSHNQIASPGQCLIKKAAIPKEWSEYITKINGSDDLFLWVLMFCSGKKFITNDAILYTHKYTGENLSESEDKMTVSSLEVAEYLNVIDYCPKDMVESFIASRKLVFGENSQGLSKAKSLAKNLDIVAFRAKWKLKGLL